MNFKGCYFEHIDLNRYAMYTVVNNGGEYECVFGRYSLHQDSRFDPGTMHATVEQ